MTAGNPRPVLRWGQAVLHRPSGPVTEFGADLEALVCDMFASMRAVGGVGLAASQIGVGLRVFVYDCPDAAGQRQAGHVVNPVLCIPAALAPPVSEAEGCLSVPGQYAVLTRPALASVTGLDCRGQPVLVTGTGLLARCLQHEADHLDGTVYLDRLPGSERTAILRAAGMGTRPPPAPCRPPGRDPCRGAHRLIDGSPG